MTITKPVLLLVLFFVLLNESQSYYALDCKEERVKEKALNEVDIDSDEYIEWKYVPRCQKGNKHLWKPQQCKKHKINGAKKCACVEQNGRADTGFTADLNGEKACTSTKCNDASIRRDHAYEKLIADGVVVDAIHIPECQSGNPERWAKTQCITGFVDHCWKVNTRTGEGLD